MSFTAAEIARAWDDAQAVWDVRVTLSPPDTAAAWTDRQHEEPLAYIDLATRQVVVNLPRLETIGARASLTAVLAHELGHHVAFPHTLGLAAALQVLEHRLMPGLPSSLTNLFFDLQVNEVVGRTRKDELAAVYRGFVAFAPEPPSPLFWFYLAIYEELWGLPAGELAGAANEAAMEQRYPGCRVDARMFAQTFWALDDTHLQFVYFASRFLRYLPRPSEQLPKIPLGGDCGEPDEDDFDRAVQGSRAGDDALEEAARRGWLPANAGKDDAGADPIGKITRHLPGRVAEKFRAALVSRQYARLVERHLVRLPATTPPPDPYLPTVPEAWQPGDDLRAIDWTLSVLAGGPLAAIAPLRRELEADLPAEASLDIPALEIYLDTSGSMPDPSAAVNVMTLAALILATSAIRKRGVVRAVVYSYGNPRESAWLYGEDVARAFLLQYAGGGTLFPFDVLERNADDRRDALRVVISDSDFLANCANGDGKQGAREILATAVGRSRLFVALLGLPELKADLVRKAIGPALDDPRFRLARVADYGKFGEAAALLARALLP